MKKNQLTTLIFSLFCILNISAQESNNSAIPKNSISGNILGTGTYLGFSYERLVKDRVSLEVGLGLIGYGFGATVYPFKKVTSHQLNAFTGIKYTNHAIVDGENKSATYLPFGLTYFGKKWVNISFDIGPSYFHHKSPGYRPTPEELAKYPFTSFGIWGNLKLGIRFNDITF